MTEAQWLSPKAENELANRIAVCMDEESRKLAGMEEELLGFETFAENAGYLDLDLIEFLKGAYRDKIGALADRIREMRERLNDMGVTV